MNEQKRYTAQEMREKVKAIELIPMMGLELTSNEKLELAAMLRQAAVAEDELVQLKASKDRWMQYQETAAGERDARIDELRKKDAEIAELRECLKEAITEYCTSRPHEFDDGFGNCENFKNGSCACSECWRLDCINKWRKALEGAKDGE